MLTRPLVMAFPPAALGASAAVRAHDLWLVPESFLPRPGATVRLEVRIGERSPESMNAPREGSLSRLALVTAAGESPLSGARIEGTALAVRFEEPPPVKALFRGAPLPDLELRSYTIGGAVRTTRTGPDGRASLRFDRPGPWCVAFIHMERCTGCAEADWRSYFCTLPFAG